MAAHQPICDSDLPHRHLQRRRLDVHGPEPLPFHGEAFRAVRTGRDDDGARDGDARLRATGLGEMAEGSGRLVGAITRGVKRVGGGQLAPRRTRIDKTIQDKKDNDKEDKTNNNVSSIVE